MGSRTAAQEEVIGEWLVDVDKAILQAINQQAGFLKTPLSKAGTLPRISAKVDVIYMHEALSDTEFQAVVQTDLLWSVMSFASVFAYTVFHTRSFLMASIGMFASTIAYPAALLIYRVIFRVRLSPFRDDTHACCSLQHPRESTTPAAHHRQKSRCTVIDPHTGCL